MLFQQLCARETKESFRVLVCIDESTNIYVQYDDRFGRELNKGPVLGFVRLGRAQRPTDLNFGIPYFGQSRRHRQPGKAQNRRESLQGQDGRVNVVLQERKATGGAEKDSDRRNTKDGD